MATRANYSTSAIARGKKGLERLRLPREFEIILPRLEISISTPAYQGLLQIMQHRNPYSALLGRGPAFYRRFNHYGETFNNRIVCACDHVSLGDAAGLIMVMQQEENSLKELEALQKIVPFAPFREIKTLHPFDLNAYYSALKEKIFATSYGMGWKGLQAVRMESPGGEFSAVVTPSTHVLGLSVRPPEKMDLRYEGVKRDMPPPAGSIAVVPAGSSVLSRWQGSKDSLLIYLEPSMVTRVAAESFELDPTRTVVPPLDGLNVPELRSAMLAVDVISSLCFGLRFFDALD